MNFAVNLWSLLVIMIEVAVSQRFEMCTGQPSPTSLECTPIDSWSVIWTKIQHFSWGLLRINYYLIVLPGYGSAAHLFVTGANSMHYKRQDKWETFSKPKVVKIFKTEYADQLQKICYDNSTMGNRVLEKHSIKCWDVEMYRVAHQVRPQVLFTSIFGVPKLSRCYANSARFEAAQAESGR